MRLLIAVTVLLFSAVVSAAPPTFTMGAFVPAPTANCVNTTGIKIMPTMSLATIQAWINSTSTVFCFQPGRYVWSSYLMLLTNKNLYCAIQGSCEITGNNLNAGGFDSVSTEHSYQIVGFYIHSFADSGSFPHACIRLRKGSTASNNIIEDCENGIYVANADYQGTNARVWNNIIQFNRWAGIAGGGGIVPDTVNGKVEIANNYIMHNGIGSDPGTDKGGIILKGCSPAQGCANSKGIWEHHNYVFANGTIGAALNYSNAVAMQGILLDSFFDSPLIEHNIVAGNSSNAIHCEVVNIGCTISNNAVGGNNVALSGSASCVNGDAEIVLSNTAFAGGTALVDSNWISAHNNGVCVTNINRMDGFSFTGPTTVSNNQMWLGSDYPSHSGYVNQMGGGGTVTFSTNLYYNLDTGTTQNWEWAGFKAWTPWIAVPQDAGSTRTTF